MHDDWLARWRGDRIGFHEGHPNALLERHIARFAGCRRVFVPLCGKAEDLAYLATRGHDVVGVELVEEAVQAFFAEHGLVPSIAPRGPCVAYQAGAFALLVGDFFTLTPDLLGPVDALYDRAALIALPPEIRPRYVASLRALVPAGALALVITLEYDQRAVAGPPFAVLEAELRALYAGATIELLGEQAATDVGKCSQSAVPATWRCFAIRWDDARS
jgi:thiopurine S-methyltransferase